MCICCNSNSHVVLATAYVTWRFLQQLLMFSRHVAAHILQKGVQVTRFTHHHAHCSCKDIEGALQCHTAAVRFFMAASTQEQPAVFNSWEEAAYSKNRCCASSMLGSLEVAPSASVCTVQGCIHKSVCHLPALSCTSLSRVCLVLGAWSSDYVCGVSVYTRSYRARLMRAL
jgi:hypothetical protein